LSDGLEQGTLSARLVTADNDLRNTNLRVNVLATKLIDCIEQASLLLALQLRHSAATDGQGTFFGL
jgi:hypothetical protein